MERRWARDRRFKVFAEGDAGARSRGRHDLGGPQLLNCWKGGRNGNCGVGTAQERLQNSHLPPFGYVLNLQLLTPNIIVVLHLRPRMTFTDLSFIQFNQALAQPDLPRKSPSMAATGRDAYAVRTKERAPKAVRASSG